MALIIVAKVAMQVGYLCVVIYFVEDLADYMNQKRHSVIQLTSGIQLF